MEKDVSCALRKDIKRILTQKDQLVAEYSYVLDLWDQLVAEYSDVFFGVADELSAKKVNFLLTEEFAVGSKNNYGLAMTEVKNDEPLVHISLISSLLPKKDFEDVLLHEMAHCAVYVEYGTMFPNENGGHNEDWYYYVDALNKDGRHIDEYGDKYLNYLLETLSR